MARKSQPIYMYAVQSQDTEEFVPQVYATLAEAKEAAEGYFDNPEHAIVYRVCVASTAEASGVRWTDRNI